MASAATLRAHDDTPTEDHMVFLRGASWEDYERILAIRGDRSAPRITYLRGTLEIMSPSTSHERIKKRLAALLEAWCIDRGRAIDGLGSATIKERREERGVEPDECYVFGDQQLERPQLAIEVEWTKGGLNKLEVYRGLGVGEVWYWRKGVIHVYVLESDGYREVPQSQLLPDLDLVELVSFVDRPNLMQSVRDFRAALAAAGR